MNISNKQQGSASEFIIRIKNNESSTIEGMIEHVQSGQVHHFSDFLNMLVATQQKLDENLHLQVDCELRKFDEE